VEGTLWVTGGHRDLLATPPSPAEGP
jgi:hypothetical protein